MVEQIPLAFEFADGVVRGPADYRREDDALIGVGTVKGVARGVAQEVRVAGRVGEIVFTVVLVQPRGFEETAVTWLAA